MSRIAPASPSSASASGLGSKLVRFAAIGALGCLVGAVLGKRLLAAARPAPPPPVPGQTICLLIALVEAASRDFWLDVCYGGKETIRVNLGATPVKIGSRARTCTIYANGARPLACSYQVIDGHVSLMDYATEQTSQVLPGDERVYGNVSVRLCSAVSSGSPAEQASAAAAFTAPPPPPKKKT